MRADQYLHGWSCWRHGRELGSLYVNAILSSRNIADAQPDNLRFAFSTCVFGYPAVITNQTSQCPVACATIQPAVETDLLDPRPSNFRDWCSSTTFADNVVNTCEFCYNLTSSAVNPGTVGGQVFLANCTHSALLLRSSHHPTPTNPTSPVLESIRYDCHFPTTIGAPFAVSPTRIFTESLLPSSMSLTTPGLHPSAGINLPVVIAVPILGFVIILIAVGVCCFFFIRWRRKRARRDRYQNHLYNRWNDTTISTPKQNGWPDAYGLPQGGYSDADPHMYGATNAGYGYGPGFGFVDRDGSGGQVGYGRDHSKGGVQQEITEAVLG